MAPQLIPAACAVTATRGGAPSRAHVAGDVSGPGSAVHGAVEHHGLAAVRAVAAIAAVTVTSRRSHSHSSRHTWWGRERRLVGCAARRGTLESEYRSSHRLGVEETESLKKYPLWLHGFSSLDTLWAPSGFTTILILGYTRVLTHDSCVSAPWAMCSCVE
jgi:hypothetical protein